MAAGDGSRQGYDAILSVGEETALGTFVTGTNSMPFYSESFKDMVEKTRIESINSGRNTQQVFQGKQHVEGSFEVDFSVQEDFIVKVFKQAFGGTVSTIKPTSTSTEYAHTFNEGNMVNNDSSVSAADIHGLSFGVQRGETSTGGWGFRGCRVNQFVLRAEVGQPVKATVDIIGIAGSLTTVAITASATGALPMIFDGVTIAEAATAASLTSATADTYIGFEWTLANNLLADDSSYQLGQRALGVLPPGMRTVSINLTQRFDTTTAYTTFKDDTTNAVQLRFSTGNTITSVTGSTTYSLQINMPKVHFMESQPEVGDVGILTHEREGICIADSLTGFAVQAIINNDVTGY